MNRSLFPFLATSRTRFSACATLTRFCARRVLCRPALPSAPALRSTDSAADCSALFVGFLGAHASSRPYLRAPGGEIPPGDSPAVSVCRFPRESELDVVIFFFRGITRSEESGLDYSHSTSSSLLR